jgi:hypothetical protein
MGAENTLNRLPATDAHGLLEAARLREALDVQVREVKADPFLVDDRTVTLPEWRRLAVD